MENWKKTSWYFQQEMYQQFGSQMWRKIDTKEHLATNLFVCLQNCYGDKFYENEKIRALTQNIEKKMLTFYKSYNQHFDCTFINLKMIDDDDKTESRYCVFWLEDKNGTTVCLDLNGRNYKSWDDFLETNKLPKCKIMYPKGGRYGLNGVLYATSYLDVVLEESKACSAAAICKGALDVVCTVGSIIGGGILLFNPVSAAVLIGAGAVCAGTGIYSAVNSAGKLIDIHKHEDGLSFDSKTILTSGELLLSVAGVAAVGASAGIKGIAAKTGTILNEGSMAFKLANNMTTIVKVVTGINVAFSIVVIVDRYKRTGELFEIDFTNLGKAILLIYNVVVSNETLKRAIEKLTSSVPIRKIIQCCMRVTNKAYKFINEVRVIASETELIKVIIPMYYSVVVEQISNAGRLIKRTSLTVDRTCRELKNQKFNSQFFYELKERMKDIWQELRDYERLTQENLEEQFNTEISAFFYRWTKNNTIVLKDENSSCCNKIKTLEELKKRVKETVSECFKPTSEREREVKEKKLLSGLLEVIDLYRWENKGPTFAMSEIDFYCTSIQYLSKALMDLFHYEYFEYVCKGNTASNYETFFSNFYHTNDIHGYVFNDALNCLKSNKDVYYKQFEENFTSLSNPDEINGRMILKFEKSLSDGQLTKDHFFMIAEELLPQLQSDLNDDSSTFDNIDDIAVIKSKYDEFMLIFKTVIENNIAKGIIVFIQDMSES